MSKGLDWDKDRRKRATRKPKGSAVARPQKGSDIDLALRLKQLVERMDSDEWKNKSAGYQKQTYEDLERIYFTLIQKRPEFTTSRLSDRASSLLARRPPGVDGA
jgi:hypothetical protein